MRSATNNLTPEFLNGWRLVLFRFQFGLSSCKYFLQRKKYPLFLAKSLRLTKNQGLPGKIRVVKFAHSYFASILRVPHWPSQPFDRMMANGGFNITEVGTHLKPHIDSAILAISRKCRYSCQHCYEYPNLAQEESIPISRWKEVIKELQKVGVSIIVFSGGEPMLRYKGLVELLESGDKGLSDFHVHTAGDGLTLKRAISLKSAGLTAAGVSLDDFEPSRQDEFRGYKGAHSNSLHAIQYFREAGVFPYVNFCLRKDLIPSNGLWKLFQFSKDLNAGFIVLLEPKPWGRYSNENADNIFSEDDRKHVTEFFLNASQDKKHKDYPLIFYSQYFERPEHLGCLMGGLSHLYIDSQGHLQPCVFLPVSFGNIREEDFLPIYTRMRKAVRFPLHKQCPSLCLAETIKKKESQGASLPIPYKEIEEDWEQMFFS